MSSGSWRSVFGLHERRLVSFCSPYVYTAAALQVPHTLSVRYAGAFEFNVRGRKGGYGSTAVAIGLHYHAVHQWCTWSWKGICCCCIQLTRVEFDTGMYAFSRYDNAVETPLQARERSREFSRWYQHIHAVKNHPANQKQRIVLVVPTLKSSNPPILKQTIQNR